MSMWDELPVGVITRERTTDGRVLPDPDLVTNNPDRIAHVFLADATESLCGWVEKRGSLKSPSSRKCPDCERALVAARFTSR